MLFSDPAHKVFPWHCGIKQNLAVWSQGRWQYFNVSGIEGVPAGSVNIVNAGSVAANTTDDLSELTTFDVNDLELLQLRFEPLMDVEVQLWEARSQARFATRTIQARVSLMTKAHDPFLESTEFNVLGRDRNAFIAVINNGDYAYAAGRVHFWGWKYKLMPLRHIDEEEDQTGIRRPVVVTATGRVPLNTAYCVAEGLGNV